MGNILNIQENQFEAEVLNSSVPVLVDFWAEWCGPCKALAPVLEDLSADFAGKVKIVKVNVDDNEELSRKYGIMSIPAIKVFKDGEIVAESVGLRNKAFLANLLAEWK